MNDKSVKLCKTGKVITRNICNYETDVQVSATYDQGMGQEYRRQLGSKRVWIAGGEIVFATELDMLNFATYFKNDGNLSQARPVTSAQISYMEKLGVNIPDGCTVEQASRLIDQAKNNRCEEGSYFHNGSGY